MNGLGLCAGGLGLELGVKLAEPDYHGVCYVERDPFCQRLIEWAMRAGHIRQAPIWDDLKTFEGRRWRGAIDLLTAGYPCQPFSAAGRRQGVDDERHLWPHVRRIINLVRPRRVFLENVEGHLSLGFDIVWREIHRLGYEVAAGVFSASEVGASHQRKRLFILADSAISRRSFAQECGADRSDAGTSAEAQGRWTAGHQQSERDRGDVADAGRSRDGAESGSASFNARGDGPAHCQFIERDDADVADAGRLSDQGRGIARDVPGSPGTSERAGHQRQWGGNTADHGREDRALAVGQADGECARLEVWSRIAADDGKERSTFERNCHGVGDASGDGWRQDVEYVESPQRRPQAGQSAGANQNARASMVDSNDDRRQGPRLHEGRRQEGLGAPLADWRGAPSPWDRLPAICPGPGDADGWARILTLAPELAPALSRADRAELARRDLGLPALVGAAAAQRSDPSAYPPFLAPFAQPIIRRVADGLASRVDRLRVLGNGVHPLAAAHAYRTLSAELAARRVGAKKADEFVLATVALQNSTKGTR